MLTSSAFFAYFILDRLFFNIRKLADIENQIDNPDQKSLFEEEKKAEGKLKAQWLKRNYDWKLKLFKTSSVFSQ